MKILSLLILSSIFLFSNKVYSQTFYNVEFKAMKNEDRSKLANFVHFDEISTTHASALLNEADFKEAQEKYPHLIKEFKKIILSEDEHTHSATYAFPKGDEKYHTYDQIVSILTNLAKSNPDIAQYFSMGNSVEGRAIPAIRITAKENRETKRFVPGIIFTGTHHAREHLSTEVPLELAIFLVKHYSLNKEIKDLVDSRDIYIAPLINPDGMLHDIKGRRYKMWRKNRTLNHNSSYGVDLNRNYSFGWGTGGSSRNPRSDVYMGPAPFSEPETTALKHFIEAKANIRIFLSFHTYSELILYPWGGKNDPVPGRDGQIFKKMAKTMSAWNGYKPMQASGLYIASGDTCDWAYGEHNIFCFTFELSPKSRWSGGGFYPGDEIIKPTFKANLKPSLFLIKRAGSIYNGVNGSSYSIF